MRHFAKAKSARSAYRDAATNLVLGRALYADVTTARIPAQSATQGPNAQWRDFGPAASLLVLGMLALCIAMLSPSGKGGQYAVIAPPWYNLSQTVALIQHADGRIADLNGGHVVIVHSDKPDFVRNLYHAGAWLVVDPLRLRGCGGDQTKVLKGRT